jgi:hypothetical protein
MGNRGNAEQKRPGKRMEGVDGRRPRRATIAGRAGGRQSRLRRGQAVSERELRGEACLWTKAEQIGKEESAGVPGVMAAQRRRVLGSVGGEHRLGPTENQVTVRMEGGSQSVGGKGRKGGRKGAQ